MRMLFLNMAPLSSNAGHLARFNLELKDMLRENDIGIVCLSKQEEEESTKAEYPKAKFFHIPISAIGWEVQNLDQVCQDILRTAEGFGADIVILQMEAWDLMHGLQATLKDKIPFATIIHAMPFIVSPLHPTGDFDKDVIAYANSGIEEYRKKYILDHYAEAHSLFKEISLVANNKTVEHYLKTYFKDLNLYKLTPSLVSKLHDPKDKADRPFAYDFAYMARMEKGKGLEHIRSILLRASELLGRKTTLLIMGKADDSWSRQALDDLNKDPLNGKAFEITYSGWAEEEDKQKLSDCGVFIYPSVYDNYPTVVNEALAFGLPVIMWNVPFFDINYSSCKAIKGIKPLDTDAFAEAAIACMSDRKALGAEALSFAQSFDDPEKVAKSDMKVFASIIASST